MTFISQQEYQEIQTTTLTTTQLIQQLDNATVHTGSYSASNIMLKYETWPNLKAVYMLIIWIYNDTMAENLIVLKILTFTYYVHCW